MNDIIEKMYIQALSGNEKLSFEQLKNKERWLENEIGALQRTLSKVQNEIFYRLKNNENGNNGKMFANCGFSSTSLSPSKKAVRKYESAGKAQQPAFSQT